MKPGQNHITNLESTESLQATLAKATTDATKAHAEAMIQSVQDTIDMLRRDYGNITIGEPRGTKWRSSAQLKDMGLIGLYRS